MAQGFFDEVTQKTMVSVKIGRGAREGLLRGDRLLQRFWIAEGDSDRDSLNMAIM